MEREEKRIFRWALILTLMLMWVLGCNKDDAPEILKPDTVDNPDPKPDSVNQAPNSFLLLTPEIDSTIVNRIPTFTWEQATDPDGDSVTYDLYLDTQENPGTLVAENLGTTSFKLTEQLVFKTQYYWKVVAKDGKGAATESTRPLIIDIPIQWLRRYDRGDEEGPIDFDYDNGELTKIGDYLTTYQSASSKLERLRNAANNVAYEYQYTATGQQREVSTGNVTGGEQWTFDYDGSDRKTLITKVATTDDGKGGVFIVQEKTVFKYDNVTNVHPAQIEIFYEDNLLNRYTLEWEGNNIVTILMEAKGMGWDELQFQANINIEYDNNINPYYRIISEQFGFGPFHVLTNPPNGMASFDFGIFKWQSFNNITAFEVFDEQNEKSLEDSCYFDYVYEDDDYPISAKSGGLEHNWFYLDE